MQQQVCIKTVYHYCSTWIRSKTSSQTHRKGNETLILEGSEMGEDQNRIRRSTIGRLQITYNRIKGNTKERRYGITNNTIKRKKLQRRMEFNHIRRLDEGE